MMRLVAIGVQLDRCPAKFVCFDTGSPEVHHLVDCRDCVVLNCACTLTHLQERQN